MKPAPPELAWTISFPLLSNRFMLYDMLKVSGWSVSLLYVLVVVVALATGNAGDFNFSFMAVILGLAGLGLLLLCLLVMAVFFRNSYTAQFAVGPDGITYQSLSRRAHAANRAAIVAGALTASAGTAGAGLLAASQESGGWAWTAIRRVNDHPSQRVLSIRNGWRVMVRLYCTPETYPAALALVASHLPPGTVVPGGNPRLGLFARRLLIGLCAWACLPSATLWMPAAAAFLALSSFSAGLPATIVSLLAAASAIAAFVQFLPSLSAASSWIELAPPLAAVAAILAEALRAAWKGARP